MADQQDAFPPSSDTSYCELLAMVDKMDTFLFFSLPRELRDAIYAELFVERQPVIQNDRTMKVTLHLGPQKSLLLISRQFKAEYEELIYPGAVLHFIHTIPTYASSPELVGSLKRVKRVEMSIKARFPQPSTGRYKDLYYSTTRALACFKESRLHVRRQLENMSIKINVIGCRASYPWALHGMRSIGSPMMPDGLIVEIPGLCMMAFYHIDGHCDDFKLEEYDFKDEDLYSTSTSGGGMIRCNEGQRPVTTVPPQMDDLARLHLERAERLAHTRQMGCRGLDAQPPYVQRHTRRYIQEHPLH